MKWSIAGLMLLGVGAAVCASVLVATLKFQTPASASTSLTPEMTQIIVAAKALPAMTVVDARSVEIKTIPETDAPDSYARRATDVIGKLLAVPVVEGQMFTSAHFLDDKSGARLASALANGMRAFSVSLAPDKAGLLYAGCVVDVLVSLNRPSLDGSATKEAISMTLLQGVQVLAIDESSVMSEADPEQKPETETASSTRRGSRERLVTLMVNSNQAKALQLAKQYGAISLVLRNPLDAMPVETDSTMLSDLADEYTRIVAALTPRHSEPPAAAAQPAAPGAASAPAPAGTSPLGVAPDGPSLAEIRARRYGGEAEPDAGAVEQEPVAEKPEDPRWETLINRSGDLELVRFRSLTTQDVKETMQWIWEGRALPSGSSSRNKN